MFILAARQALKARGLSRASEARFSNNGSHVFGGHVVRDGEGCLEPNTSPLHER